MNTPTPAPVVDFGSLHWTKASASGENGACVELAAAAPGWVALRDSKHPEALPHLYTQTELAAFIDGAKKGEFDHLT